MDAELIDQRTSGRATYHRECINTGPRSTKPIGAKMKIELTGKKVLITGGSAGLVHQFTTLLTPGSAMCTKVRFGG
jgi:hypothetical protein